jgi:hypothetical protein
MGNSPNVRPERRSIILMGTPHVNEEGVATAVVKPGYLVDGVTQIAAHASAAGACPRTFALEREELGAGIDNLYLGTGTISSDYAIGDTVKVGSFKQGERVYAFVASGQTILENSRLESAGDGTLRLYSAGVIIGRALEAVTSLALSRLRTEIM